MLLKSDTVHNAWAATQRTVGVKLTIKGTEYDASDITSLTFDSGAMNGEALTLGSTYQNTIKVVFSRLIEGLALTDEIAPELGIKLADGTWDYTPLGVFVIDAEVKQDRNNNTTTISASDRMCMMGGTYKSKLTYPAAINDIAVEVANLAAVKLNDDDFARLPTDKVANFGSVTYRDAIGYVAQFAGGFATFDRDGLLDIRQLADPNFEVAPSQYQSKGLTKNEALYRIGGIACTVTTTTKDDSGNETQDTKTLQSGSSAGTQITISNPGMTQDLLDGLYEQLQDLNFYPFSLSWFGDPNLEVGDWIEVQDTAGNTFKTPNLLYSLTFSGGVTATSKADTTVSASANFVYKGQLHQIVDNIRQYLNAAGQQVSEGIDEPLHPKAGDVWFKKSGPDTFIMMYKIDPETGLGAWVEEVSTKGVSGLDAELKAAKAQLNADLSAADANLQVAKQDVADLQVKLKANDDAQAQLTKDLSANSTILAQAQADIVTNTQALSDLDTKLKANDDIQTQLKNDLAANTKVQAQLTTDLAANTKLINANKESVDAALVTVNETLTQAQTDTATAVKNADLAVTNAQSALDASGLAINTANSASDAALAAKNLATQVSSDFDGVRSQAATAANDAATALDQAKSAIGNASDALTQAKSALATANGVQNSMQPAITTAVDTAKGELTASIQTVQNNLDNIQVGGRNYLEQSSTFKWTHLGEWHVDTEAYQGHAVLTGTQTVNYSEHGFSYTSLPFVNSDVVVSFYAKAAKSSRLHSEPHGIGGGSGATDFMLTTEWARYIYKAHVGSIGTIYWWASDANIQMWVTMPQVELGTVVSDYQVAPEDVQSQITTNSTNITANSKEIALAAKQSTVDALSQTVTDQGAKLDLTATSAQLKVTENKVDALNKTVSDNSTQLKLTATSAALETQSKRVDTISGQVDTNTAGITAANGEIELKASNSRVDTLEGTVKQQGIDLTAAQGELKLKITQNDLTKGLDGYATQTWAQNQITATATELNSTMMTVQTQVQNSAVGTNLLYGTAEFNPWIGDLQFFTNGHLGLTVALEKDSDGDIAWHLSGTANDGGVVGSYNWKLASAYPSTYAFSVSVKGTFANTTLCAFNVEGSSNVTNSIDWSSTYSRWVATGNVASGNGAAAVLYFDIKSGDVVDIWVKKWKLEKGSVATDWCPNPADNASVTALSQLSQTVDGLTGTFATKNDLANTATQFKVTADGLNLLTTATGTKGEKVTQVIADVDNIKSTMTGANGYTTRLQTLEGFQQTASSNISTLQSQQTLLSNQWTSVVGMGANLLPDGDFENDNINDTARYWNSAGYVRENPVKTSQTVNISNQCIEIEANSGNNDWTTTFLIPVKEGVRYKYQFMERWNSGDQVGTVIGYVFEYGADRKLITPVPLFSDSTPQNWHLMSGTYTVRAGVKYVALDVTYADGHNSGRINIDDVFFAEDVANNTMITQLQNQIDLRTTVAGKVTAALSLSNDGGGTVTIRGSSLYVTADSHFDNASIQSAAIASIDAGKITSGSISAYRLATTKLNADNITSGSISADRLATTKLNASNITSGSINAGLITTGVLSADMIVGGTFDASKMTVKNIDAGSITSGSIATSLLASTEINANNITSGTIAAERIATTALSATNIVSGTLDVGKLTVKNLSADMIASGTIDASKITVKNLSASNIIGGELDALLVNVKNLNADNIITGTLNAGLVNVIGLNAESITTGTIKGANLAINLNSGEVLFTKGSIKSIDGHLNIDVNDGTFAQSDGTKGMLFAKGNLYLSSSSWWDGLSNPDAAPKPDYGFIGYTDTLLTERGFGVIGRDALTIGLTDNGNPGMEYTSSPVITMNRSDVTLDFAGELATIQAGKGFTINTNPYYSFGKTPGIQIGSNVDRSGIGDRVFIDGSYVYIPSAYSRTSSGSANLIVASDGALVRTSSATKYKSNIERFRKTDMGEALLNLPQAHWYNKQDMQRYTDDPQHYSMPMLDYGMIAEDLAAAGLEDLVVRGDDGQLEDIRYDRMTPALLPLLAKMKQEIEELKSAAKSA